jgi:hypothetical protein
MKLSDFLKKYNVSKIETELALKVHSDIEMAEDDLLKKLQNSVSLTLDFVKKEETKVATKSKDLLAEIDNNKKQVN